MTRPGSPLVRTRVAQGRQPDYYALTRQNHSTSIARPSRERGWKTSTLAWKVIGHRHRRIYELIAHHELDKPDEIFAAAHIEHKQRIHHAWQR